MNFAALPVGHAPITASVAPSQLHFQKVLLHVVVGAMFGSATAPEPLTPVQKPSGLTIAGRVQPDAHAMVSVQYRPHCAAGSPPSAATWPTGHWVDTASTDTSSGHDRKLSVQAGRAGL